MNPFLPLMVTLIAIAVTALPAGCEGYSKGYRQGQIDAANDRWFYRLQRDGSGQEVWVKQEKPTTRPRE